MRSFFWLLANMDVRVGVGFAILASFLTYPLVIVLWRQLAPLCGPPVLEIRGTRSSAKGQLLSVLRQAGRMWPTYATVGSLAGLGAIMFAEPKGEGLAGELPRLLPWEALGGVLLVGMARVFALTFSRFLINTLMLYLTAGIWVVVLLGLVCMFDPDAAENVRFVGDFVLKRPFVPETHSFRVPELLRDVGAASLAVMLATEVLVLWGKRLRLFRHEFPFSERGAGPGDWKEALSPELVRDVYVMEIARVRGQVREVRWVARSPSWTVVDALGDLVARADAAGQQRAVIRVIVEAKHGRAGNLEQRLKLLTRLGAEVRAVESAGRRHCMILNGHVAIQAALAPIEDEDSPTATNTCWITTEPLDVHAAHATFDAWWESLTASKDSPVAPTAANAQCTGKRGGASREPGLQGRGPHPSPALRTRPCGTDAGSRFLVGLLRGLLRRK